MDLSLEMNVEQTVKVSPTLIAVNTILALSSQELQNLIKQEAEENPALEITEHQTCAICGDQLRNGVCINCLRTGAMGTHTPDNSDDFNFSSLGYADEAFRPNGPSAMDEDDFDPISLVASEPSMRERLMLDLRSALSSHDFPIADYILGSLDDRGFLTCDVQTLSEELAQPLDDVTRVLEVLQKLGPPGIGAR